MDTSFPRDPRTQPVTVVTVGKAGKAGRTVLFFLPMRLPAPEVMVTGTALAMTPLTVPSLSLGINPESAVTPPWTGSSALLTQRAERHLLPISVHGTSLETLHTQQTLAYRWDMLPNAGRHRASGAEKALAAYRLTWFRVHAKKQGERSPVRAKILGRRGLGKAVSSAGGRMRYCTGAAEPVSALRGTAMSTASCSLTWRSSPRSQSTAHTGKRRAMCGCVWLC